MKKIAGLKALANLTFFIMFVGAVVFTFGFGTVIHIAREDVKKETDQKVQQSVSLIQGFVDGQLQRVEDVAYTLLSSDFADAYRKEDGEVFVTTGAACGKLPSEEMVFGTLEHFLNVNPQICGVAVGFEPFLYKHAKGKYGVACYVTNVSGENRRLKLGEIHEFHEKEWYRGAASTNAPYWSRPFTETSQGKVVACFSVPLHGKDGELIGVLALDIDTKAFRDKCNEVSPFPRAEVSLVDRDFRIISHTNESYIMKLITEVEQYASYQSDDSLKVKMLEGKSGQHMVNKGTDHEAMFYFAPIRRTGWMISIECPKDEIYANVTHMKRATAVVAVISLLFMILCFVFLFLRMQSVTKKKAGIERDLQIASAIQMGMLPKLYPAFPERTDIDVFGFLKPAKTVGGDLYDYFIRDGKLFFCIGDVSGKGVPASLFMAVIRALFRNVSLHSEDPADILSSLNTAISDGNDHNMFCTMFLGILDLETGHLDYCNAGHNSPVIRRIKDDGTIEVGFADPQANIAIGVFDGFSYVKEETVLKPGEAIFLYTDGVTEAEDVHKNLFGDEAALHALADARNHKASSAKSFVEYVYDVVKTYAEGTEQSDDITMVVVEFKGKQEEPENRRVLHLKNNIMNVPTLGEWVESLGEETGLQPDRVFQLNLALEEAVVNVMNYAYPGQEGMPVDVSVDISDEDLKFRIVDSGVPFNPLEHEDPDITLGAEEREIGGLGIMLVRKLMEETSYEYRDGNNILTLIMKR